MLILPFSSSDITLETAGGKGANLARLTRAGFQVPRGFIISTDAYRAFVEANRWLPMIESTVENISAEDRSALERISAQIRAAFLVGVMPTEIESAIRAAYVEFKDIPVAVVPPQLQKICLTFRLPGNKIPISMSSARTEVLKAVINCWSSLWTARAIGYRLRNHIPQEEVALAVVLQEMIPSETLRCDVHRQSIDGAAQ